MPSFDYEIEFDYQVGEQWRSATIPVEVSFSGAWHPPDPEVGYMWEWYEVYGYDLDYALPDDYVDEAQDVPWPDVLAQETASIEGQIMIEVEYA